MKGEEDPTVRRGGSKATRALGPNAWGDAGDWAKHALDDSSDKNFYWLKSECLAKYCVTREFEHVTHIR